MFDSSPLKLANSDFFAISMNDTSIYSVAQATPPNALHPNHQQIH